MDAMKNSVRKLVSLSLAACTALTMSFTAFADEPYESYNYDNWDEAIPSQSGYTVQKTVTGTDMGLDRLSDPADELYFSENASVSLNEAKDVFVYNDSEIWVADTGNNRILRLDTDYNITGRYYYVTGESESGAAKSPDGTGTAFNSPQGLYVTKSPSTGLETIYIADYENSRVVRASVSGPTELTLEKEFLRPEESLYNSTTYNPTKVIADGAENVYVIVKSVNTGSVQFSPDGEFMGYYGANRVEVTAKVIAQRFWRKIASNEQIRGMQRNVPIEYVNFDIDNEGFIYTVTEAPVNTDAVKKINAAGYNIWNNALGDDYVFGDHTEAVWDMATNKTYATRLTDIAVNEQGIINVLDFETGRVFQYDKLCNLICIFGTKTSNADQKGAFTSPNAVETIGDTVIVLEGSKSRNDLTVFERTVFGEDLHKAFSYFDEGLYVEAVPYWNEVIKRDGGYTYAHVGLGKADLKNHEYKSAMKRFKIANDKKDYDKAFEYYREEWLQSHFTGIAVVIVILFLLWIVKSVMRRRGRRFRDLFGGNRKNKREEGSDGLNV